MKKFNDANVGLFVLLTACLSLFSCNNDNDNYPKNYVGFEKSTRTVECDKNQSESELQIKIIATAKSIIDKHVILEIKVLLKSTNLSVQEISNQLCFPDQSFFGRYFKKHTGLSPLQYRNQN